MAFEAGEVRVRITGDTTGLSNSLTRAEASLRASGQRLRQQGQQITTGLTLPLIALGGAFGRTAAQFETEMVKINTLVGVAPDIVNQWRQSILELAPAVGRGPRELARALFVVTSAGQRGAEALEIVESAAKAAAIGLGDTTDIARAVTAAVNAYGQAGLTAARATDVMVATVREGNLEASDLAGTLGRVIGIASQVGITFEEVGGFIATFTRLGVRADEAVTSLRGIMNAVLKPSQDAREAFEEAGVPLDEFRRKIREDGLAAALLDLVAGLNGNTEALARIIPNVRALAGVLGTAGAQGEQFRQIVESIEDSMGILDEGFATVQSTLAQTFAEFKAKAEVAAISIGDRMAPALDRLLTAAGPVINILGGIIQAFSFLPGPIRGAALALTVLAAAIGPVMFLFGNLKLAAAGLIGQLAKLSGGTGVIAALGTLLGPTGAVIVGLGAMVGLFVKMRNEAREAREEVAKLNTEFANTFADFVVSNLGNIEERIREAGNDPAKLRALREDIAAELDSLGGVIRETDLRGAAPADLIKGAEFEDLKNRVTTGLKGAVAAINAEATRGGDAVPVTATRAVDGRTEQILAALRAKRTDLERAVGQINGILEAVGEQPPTEDPKLEGIRDALKNFAEEMSGARRQSALLGESYDFLGAKQSALQTLMEDLAPIVDDVKQAFATGKFSAMEFDEIVGTLATTTGVSREQVLAYGLTLEDVAAALQRATAAASAHEKEQERIKDTMEIVEAALKKTGSIFAGLGQETEAVTQLVNRVRFAKFQQELRIAEQSAQTVSESVTDAFFEIVDGSKSVLQSIADMVTGVLRELARLAVQRTLLDTFGGLFGTGRVIEAPEPVTSVEAPEISEATLAAGAQLFEDIGRSAMADSQKAAGAALTTGSAALASAAPAFATAVGTFATGTVTATGAMTTAGTTLTVAGQILQQAATLLFSAATQQTASSLSDTVSDVVAALPKRVKVTIGDPKVEPRAEGGNVRAGILHLVGEEGPELFVPRSNGSIIPNDLLEGGGGRTVVHQTVEFNIRSLDGKDTARVLRQNAGEIRRIVEEGAQQSYRSRNLLSR